MWGYLRVGLGALVFSGFGVYSAIPRHWAQREDLLGLVNPSTASHHTKACETLALAFCC